MNLLLAGLRCGVADLAGCWMGTDLADILFGIPRPTVSAANLGTLRVDAVNITLHGHNPVFSEVLVGAVAAKEEAARAAGVTGINLVGTCCTGNEVMMRHGILACTHPVNQEMAILAGAVDAMVVDYQCLMPSVVNIAECAGTRIITTMDIARISGATHVDFSEWAAVDKACEIIAEAIDQFRRRRNSPVEIPAVKTPVMAAFSFEEIVAALAHLDAEQSLKPLVDSIKAGNIRGVCLFVGDIANSGLHRLVIRERLQVDGIKMQMIDHRLHNGHLLCARGRG